MGPRTYIRGNEQMSANIRFFCYFRVKFMRLAKQGSSGSRRNSAALRLLKVESGINGSSPLRGAPSIYSVSLLIRLRYALEEVTVFCVRPLCARSSRPAAKRKIKACDFLHSCGKNAAA